MNWFLSREQVKNMSASPGVTKIGQALQSLHEEGSHASVSPKNHFFCT
jgi:hypothetical protein